MKRALSDHEELVLSEKPGFALHWRALAESLGFTAAEIERIIYDNLGDAERCFQLLHKWKQREHPRATVSKLVEAIYSIKNAVMLDIANDVLH